MPKSWIQFQAGLSLTAFQRRYGSESKCRRVLFQMKWPHGFSCPHCHHHQYWFLRAHARYECQQCGHQTSVTVGTLLQSTKLPLQLWFYAAYLLTQAKNSISTLSLKRALGVSYNSAWRIGQKIIMAMQQDEDKQPLSGMVQVDDAYMGGRKRGGKRGRGAQKQPFVAAISLRNTRPYRAKFSVVNSFKQRDLASWAQTHLHLGTQVMTDGLAGFRGFEAAGMAHTAIKTTGNQHAQDVIFRWVNTILGNVKRAIDGTYHAVRRPYVDRYLSLFQYRFNHRFDLKGMMTHTLRLMVKTSPISSNLTFRGNQVIKPDSP